MTSPYDWIERSLATIQQANWHRSVKTIGGRPGAVVELDGRQVINFASNDYLGLAGDERLVQAAIAATRKYGTGATGSRLLTGHRDLHTQLEQAIANFKQTEAAIVFSSGYLANLGTISAIVGQRDLILSDQYNHSSLKNGAILSGATTMEYVHCNMTDLRQHLEQHRAAYRRCLILTDSVFSMDGDLCPLPDILNLAAEFDAMVLVDEAHGTGVLGATGAGCVEHFGCRDRPLIQMGTLSKAIGSLGGYVTGSAALINLLRNRAPSWIYTTGLAPAAAAAALEAIRIIQTEPDRRDRLWQNITHLHQQLGLGQNEAFPSANTRPAAQLPTACCLLPSNSPILCLTVDSPASVLRLGEALLNAGLFVAAVRPPTVPTSRLRLTVMATHERNQLEQLATEINTQLSSFSSNSGRA